MVLPERVAECGPDAFTDDELVAAFVDVGDDQALAELMVEILRGRVVLPFGIQA